MQTALHASMSFRRLLITRADDCNGGKASLALSPSDDLFVISGARIVDARARAQPTEQQVCQDENMTRQ